MDSLATGALSCFWKLTPEACAAWVQAIFSIIGIMVAIGVPWRLKYVEQMDQKRKDAAVSRGLALFLLPAVQHWRGQFSASPDSGTRSMHAMFNDSYRVPLGIADDIQRLHLLGSAARYLQAAVFLAREIEVDLPIAANRVGKGFPHNNHQTPRGKTSESLTWEEKLDRLTENLESAEREMLALFDEGTPE